MTDNFARQMGVGAHDNQAYGSSDRPYSIHLDHVVQVIQRFGIDDDAMVCAGYLHDTLEDTDLLPDQIQHWFGSDVLALVEAVTDEPGKNRKERHEKTYPKIVAAGQRAIALKLADRIANVEHSLANGSQILQMYRKEHAEFSKALRISGDATIDRMWDYLARLLA